GTSRRGTRRRRSRAARRTLSRSSNSGCGRRRPRSCRTARRRWRGRCRPRCLGSTAARSCSSGFAARAWSRRSRPRRSPAAARRRRRPADRWGFRRGFCACAAKEHAARQPPGARPHGAAQPPRSLRDWLQPRRLRVALAQKVRDRVAGAARTVVIFLLEVPERGLDALERLLVEPRARRLRPVGEIDQELLVGLLEQLLALIEVGLAQLLQLAREHLHIVDLLSRMLDRPGADPRDHLVAEIVAFGADAERLLHLAHHLLVGIVE